MLCALLLGGTAHAIDVTIFGSGWSPSIGVVNLLAGAGSDFISAYDNSSNPGTITISGTSGDSDAWRVDVRRTDGIWHGNLALSAKRTGDGAGPGSISGGETYQVVATTDSAFFSGAGDKGNVPIQLELGGVSLQVPPGNYSTTITYTVVDL